MLSAASIQGAGEAGPGGRVEEKKALESDIEVEDSPAAKKKSLAAEK
jgi:hypothetical protein